MSEQMMVARQQRVRWMLERARAGQSGRDQMWEHGDVVMPWPLEVCDGVTVLPKTRPICADYPALEVQR